MNDCCQSTCRPKAPQRGRTIRELSAWAATAVLFAVTPKCPLCLMGYVALWSGIGLSLTTATYLRWALLASCCLSLTLLVAIRIRRYALRLR